MAYMSLYGKIVKCQFCDDVEFLKLRSETSESLTHEYKVKLVQETYVSGVFRGSATFKARPLKYCPMCGAKMDLEDE